MTAGLVAWALTPSKKKGARTRRQCVTKKTIECGLRFVTSNK